MARGLALILAAVVLGVVLLNATDEPEPFEAADGDGGRPTATSTTVEDTDDTEPGGDGTTPTSTVVRDPSQVSVLVANATGRSGVAKSFTDQLAALNYVTKPPANAEPADASVVYFRPGFEAEAQAVAAVLNPAPQVLPLPDPVPVDDLRGADVLLVVGPDLAPG